MKLNNTGKHFRNTRTKKIVFFVQCHSNLLHAPERLLSNIPAHVRPELFLMSGLGRNRENVATLITALVISRVYVQYP